jgi:hypothetical protein
VVPGMAKSEEDKHAGCTKFESVSGELSLTIAISFSLVVEFQPGCFIEMKQKCMH